MKVETENASFKLDTGSDVTVIPYTIYQKIKLKTHTLQTDRLLYTKGEWRLTYMCRFHETKQ